MNISKKILPIILSLGLIQGSFGLTVAAKKTEIKETSVKKTDKEDTYNVKKNKIESYDFDLTCYFKFTPNEEKRIKESPKEKDIVFKEKNVKSTVAVHIMVNDILKNLDNKRINKSFDVYLNVIAASNLLKMDSNPISLNKEEKIEKLTKKDFKDLKKVLKKENLEKVKITKKKYKKAIESLTKKLKERIKEESKKSKNSKITKELKDNLKELKKVNFESVKETVKNLTKCEFVFDINYKQNLTCKNQIKVKD